MSTTFEQQLDLLYASYAALPPVDSSTTGSWSGIHERALDGDLIDNDWQTIWIMFRTVVASGAKNREDWFQTFSRWFGTADHRVKFPSQPDALDGPVIGEGPITVASSVDPDKLGLLLYVYGLTPVDSPMTEGLHRYGTLDPDLRSHFTDQMLVIEQALTALQSLRPEDVTPDLKLKLADPLLPTFLRHAFVDHKDLLFEHGSLAVLLYNTVLNSLWEGKPVNVYRVHINMTTVNEKDDTGQLGNIYLRVVRSWFQEKFGNVHVVQNPERTTFEFVASSVNLVRSVMSDYDAEIRHRIEKTPGAWNLMTRPVFPRAVISERTLTRENLFRYAIRSDDDLDVFRPVIEFGNHVLSVDRLKGIATGEDLGAGLASLLKIDFDAIKQASPEVRKTLNALIIKAMLELNAELAAQTSFFERQYNGDSPEEVSGTQVFVEGDLPRRGDGAYEKWQGLRKRKVGYVGPGQYDPARDNPELADLESPQNISGLHPVADYLLRIIPRLGHLKGLLSHSRAGSEGGFLERFVASLREIADLPDGALAEEVRSKVIRLQIAARDLLEEFEKFHSLAITDPRNRWTMKQHRQFPVHRGSVTEEVHSNFFVQEVARSGNRYLVALEYDSFRAFNLAYARHDAIDSDYHRVRDAVFVAAKRMNMPRPIVNPAAGDHISISFSGENRTGEAVDPVAYCRLVQQIVHEAFADRPFQDYHKVERNGEIVRLPMWIDEEKSGGERWFFGSVPPAGSKQFRRSLTISLALGEHRPLKGPADLAHFGEVENHASLALGEVKRTSWPHKEGFVDIRGTGSVKSPEVQGPHARRSKRLRVLAALTRSGRSLQQSRRYAGGGPPSSMMTASLRSGVPTAFRTVLK